MKLRIILALLFIATLAWGDSKVVGHIVPFPHEMLDQPVELQCGAEVIEWRGAVQTSEAEQYVDALCTIARDHFELFILRYGYRRSHDRKFQYSISLLPDNQQYRSLNDLQYRFAYRPKARPVWGYTSISSKFVFLFSNTKHHEFAGTFLHEIFHGLSNYYGLWRQYSGDYEERCEREEALAAAFEKELAQ